MGSPIKQYHSPHYNPFQFFGKPFERLIIDCVGPLPTVKTGHQCLLMMISASTCYPEAVPLRSIQAVTSLDVKLLFVFIFAFTCMLWISMLYFMLYCVQFLSLSHSLFLAVLDWDQLQEITSWAGAFKCWEAEHCSELLWCVRREALLLVLPRSVLSPDNVDWLVC